MRNSITWLFAAATVKTVYEKKAKKMVDWRINFVTLTIKTGLAELHEKGFTDTKLKRVLNSWLSFARSRFGLKSYVWKAETQKRGVLHFHLTTDCYMYWKDVRASWNRVLMNNGLEQDNANSTDIHAVVNYDKVQEYLIKYFNKGEANKRSVVGRLWSRSYELARLKCQVEMPDDEIGEFTRLIKSDVFFSNEFLTDHAHILNLKDGYWKAQNENDETKQEYLRCIETIRSNGKK